MYSDGNKIKILGQIIVIIIINFNTPGSKGSRKLKTKKG